MFQFVPYLVLDGEDGVLSIRIVAIIMSEQVRIESGGGGVDQPSLLVVGVEQRQSVNGAYNEAMNGLSSNPASSRVTVSRHYLSPAISLNVINATLAESFWTQMKDGFVDQGSGLKGDDCISLQDCSIWPMAGMEIKDGWTRTPVRRGDSRDKLFGMLGLQRVSVTNRICETCLLIDAL